MDGFLLATTEYVLRARGGEGFPGVDEASRAIRDGTARLVTGALPFHPSVHAALIAPATAVFDATLPAVSALPRVVIEEEIPGREMHVKRVAALVDRLASTELRKVVAARSVIGRADAPIDPEQLVAALVARAPGANGYAVDLTPGGRTGQTLVGASPELLVSVRGDRVRLHPLAGTAPRHPDPVIDQEQAATLLASEKNREEHSYVIDWIADRLGPMCVELNIPAGPELISTPDVWHLATPITGRLSGACTALDLAVLLHPTPAVCGTPTELALSVITETEEDRGFYGGAVGWCDANGDGDWIVAIRCAELSADARTARAYAGGGIVIGSDPEAELVETTVKLRTLLAPLGVRL